MFGFLLGFSYLSFVELLNAQRSSIIQNLKDEDIFEISSYKKNNALNWLYLLKSSLLQGMANLSFSLRERQNSARFNYVAVTISKMTSRSCEERNCFKGLTLFFLTTTSNIALTFPTNTELVGCLEGGRELKFVTNLCTPNKWCPFLNFSPF